MEYNFLIDQPPKPANFGAPPAELPSLGKFTPKMFLKDIGDAYKSLGGLTWLIAQAKVAPQEFLKLLNKIIPRQVDLDLMEGTTIRLIDQFGQTIEIVGSHPKAATGVVANTGTTELPAPSPRSGQPELGGEIATSGSPTPIIIEEYPNEQS